MRERILSTIILWLFILILPAVLGNPGAAFIILLLATGTIWEGYHLVEKQYRGFKAIGPFANSILLLLITLLYPWTGFHVLQALPLILVSAALFELPQGAQRRWLSCYGAHLTILLLITLPFAFVLELLIVQGFWVVVWLTAVIKFTDAGALLIGSAIGRHKMAPKLSPKKTWEGLIGGLFCGMVASAASFAFFGKSLPFTLQEGLLIALPVALTGVFSDLVESALKREAGMKDSGNLVPGIGGCFDLTDSIILSAPTLVFLLNCLN